MRIELGSLTQPSLMILVGLGAVMSVLFVALRHRTFHHSPSYLNLLDIGLATLVMAVLGARLGYIVLDGGAGLRGGLSWHSGLMVGMATLAILSRWRKLDQTLLWDSVAWCLPLIMFLAWWGCMGASCGFGREVETLADYPPFFAWEGRDLNNTLAPRFATQALGMMGAVMIGLILGWIAYKKWLIGRWLGLVLVMIGAVMFGIGFLRADMGVNPWFDVGVMMGGAVMCLTRPIVRRFVPQATA